MSIKIVLMVLNFISINSIKFLDLINTFKSKENISSNSFKKLTEENLFEITDYERINPDDPNFFYIPIFSSSDIHGHFYEEEYEVGNLSYSRGGLDYLAKYANIIREEFKNQFLYLDAGDLFQGGTESTLTNGAIILDYLNLINSNGSTIGNHEYDYSRQNMENKVDNAKFPFLATNLYDINKKTKKVFGDNHFTSRIYTFKDPNNEKENEIKIGVVGLTMDMRGYSISGEGYEDIHFLEYKDELVSEANSLREESGVNAVVLLAHIGLGCGSWNNLTLNIYKPTDEQEECNQGSDLYKLIYDIEEGLIDAVVTGHSHRAVHHFVRNIPIISPINNGLYANIIYLAFDKNNNYTLVREQSRIEGPLPICRQIFKQSLKCEFIKKYQFSDYLPLVNYSFHNVKIEKDPILQPIHDKYDEMYSEYNGKVCSVIGTDNILTIETNGSFYLGNIMADMQSLVTGANISIVSHGNLRAEWNPGRIPRYKVQDLLPFGNHLCTFTMTGEEIKRTMRIIQAGRKKYYVTSGLKQIFTKNNKDNNYYLDDIKLYDGYKESEIDLSREYLIAANTFLVGGGDDFDKVVTWHKYKNLNCGHGSDLELFETYLKNQKIIDVNKYMDDNNPRIRFIDS